VKNPLKRYYFACGETQLKMFDCTINQWRWQNPQDAVTEVLEVWRQMYGKNGLRVTIKYFGRI
jgi:hypothetical protein